MNETILSELLKLPEAERIQLVQDLWDSIPADSQSLAAGDAEIQEWERRIHEHDADPASAISWEDAREALRAKFGA